MMDNVKHSFTITKFGESINEDAILVRDNLVAVSDGAGGGGVYADEWSRYLLDCLPDKPFDFFEELDAWVSEISDAFYDKHEELAKQKGGLFLEKFYDEGSFATLSAIWKVSDTECVWISYGDSVVFVFDPETNVLKHSFTSLIDFNKAPDLIGLITPMNKGAYRSGRISIAPNSYVFVTSDALAHYIMAKYCLVRGMNEDVQCALESKSRNANYVKALLANQTESSFMEIMTDIAFALTSPKNAESLLQRLYQDGVIALDDYSLAFMPGHEPSYEKIEWINQIDIEIPKSIPGDYTRIADIKPRLEGLEDIEKLRNCLTHCSGPVLYRAHSKQSWGLKPPAMRDPIVPFEMQLRHYNDLKDYCIELGYDKYRLPSFNEDLFYMGIGRHMGLNCCLLDWTASFDVALECFLLEEGFMNVDGALWVMLVPSFELLEHRSPFGIDDQVIHVLKAPFYSPNDKRLTGFPAGILRRYHQHGFFTATSENLMNIELNGIPSKNGICFRKFVVTPELKRIIRSRRNRKRFQIDKEHSVGWKTWYYGRKCKESKDLEMFVKGLNAEQ